MWGYVFILRDVPHGHIPRSLDLMNGAGGRVLARLSVRPLLVDSIEKKVSFVGLRSVQGASRLAWAGFN